MWQLGGTAQEFEMVGEDVLARPKAVYPSLSANTKGLWVELTSASTIDASAFTVMIPYAYEGSDYLVDIGIGAAGSEQVLVDNLAISAGSTAGNNPSFNPRIPVPIPSGTRISVRAQATGTSGSRMIRCAVLLENNDWPSGGIVTTIGAATADSGGGSIDPGASDNVKGAWVELSASTALLSNAAFFCFGNQANTARADCFWLVDIGVGGAGSEQVIIPNIAIGAHITTDSISPAHTPVYNISIPAGTRVAARASCTIVDATDRLFDLIMYSIS